MAKKRTAKERRMEELAKRQEKFKLKEKERQEEERRKEEARQEAARQKELEKIKEECGEDTRTKKSRAKAAGVKSTFILDNNRILMTSFGKGNQALRDKYISGDHVEDASEQASLTVSPKEKEFFVSGRNSQEAVVGNPAYSKKKDRKPGQDLIHCRDKLEKMYFGQEFEDNIHIQLIYNILDIEKVLAVQVNNIVFSLNNLLRQDGEEHDDFIGYLSLKDTYEAFCANAGKSNDGRELYDMFQKLIKQPQLGYFGTTFLPIDEKGKRIQGGEEWRNFEKKCYNLFAVLGMLRQATAHGSQGTRASIYKMEVNEDDEKQKTKSCRLDAGKELDRLYQTRIHELNRGFLDKAKKDLTIFFRVFHADNEEMRKYLVQQYYEFVVLKTYKNTGFSIKRLRETMIAGEEEAGKLADKEYDSVRQKLYRAVDLTIYLYYQKEGNQEKAEKLIEQLRATTKEYEKEFIYRKEAKTLWKELKEVILDQILPKMDGKYIKDINPVTIDQEVLKDIFVKETASRFSEMIYLLTIFLDGKEINDLLTQLINRFENISSFIDVLKEENLWVGFKKDYKLFENSRQISEELRIINSFARMSVPAPSAKKIMFIEAAQVLGYSENDEEMEAYIDDEMLKPKKEIQAKNKNGFRNFIINNVIESSRFKYLVRYGNPKKIRKLASNRKVVDFVLKDIPDAQITAYYNSCTTKSREFSPEMRNELAKIITGLHFKDFEKVYQDKTNDREKQEDKERKKNIIRLYLTVLYLLQKNLIYVNSRYFLAFHCAERDDMVYDSKDKEYAEEKKKGNRAAFAKFYVDKICTNKRAKEYLTINFQNSDPWSFRVFRNCTEHLNAVRNADKYIGDIGEFHTYFELYHYLVQRCLIDQYNFECNLPSKKNPGTMVMSEEQAEGKLLKYFKCVKEHKTYCKDFVKALNVPFAYNLPRYKNLSINELFDRNHYLPNKGKEMEPEEKSEEK